MIASLRYRVDVSSCAVGTRRRMVSPCVKYCDVWSIYLGGLYCGMYISYEI